MANVPSTIELFGKFHDAAALPATSWRLRRVAAASPILHRRLHSRPSAVEPGTTSARTTTTSATEQKIRIDPKSVRIGLSRDPTASFHTPRTLTVGADGDETRALHVRPRSFPTDSPPNFKAITWRIAEPARAHLASLLRRCGIFDTRCPNSNHFRRAPPQLSTGSK